MTRLFRLGRAAFAVRPYPTMNKDAAMRKTENQTKRFTIAQVKQIDGAALPGVVGGRGYDPVNKKEIIG